MGQLGNVDDVTDRFKFWFSCCLVEASFFSVVYFCLRIYVRIRYPYVYNLKAIYVPFCPNEERM